MVIFDQLRISDDGQSLFINAHVNKASYFDNVSIKRVTICTEDQVSELHPEVYGDDFIYQQDFISTEESVGESAQDSVQISSVDNLPIKEINLVLNKNSFNEKFTKGDLSHNMFFVYVECDGTPSSDTPCTLDEMTTLGVTYDYEIFYNQAMNYTKELGDSCNISSNFIDFILNTEALKLSLETEHYTPAIRYWKNLLGEVNTVNTKPCGCHG